MKKNERWKRNDDGRQCVIVEVLPAPWNIVLYRYDQGSGKKSPRRMTVPMERARFETTFSKV